MIGLVFLTYSLYGDSEDDSSFVRTGDNFYFTADYLNESSPMSQYPAYDSFSLTIYNYDKDNTALVSSVDVVYTTKIQYYNASDVQVGSDVTTSSNTLTSGQARTTTLSVPKVASASYCIVTVATTAPYVKTITARFNFPSVSADSTYSFSDEGGYCELTIYTGNSYLTPSLSWSSTYYAPDDTNPVLSGYTTNGTTQSITLSLSAYSTYSIVFFENSSVNHTEIVNTAYTTSIVLAND